MGCDIHCFTEVRNKDGIWENQFAKEPNYSGVGFKDGHHIFNDNTQDEYYALAENPYIHRNYELFALLNRVRGEFDFSMELPQGVPENASTPVKIFYEQEDADAHSGAYVTRHQLQIKATELTLLSSQQAAYALHSLKAMIEALPAHDGAPQDQRVIFWFDN